MVWPINQLQVPNLALFFGFDIFDEETARNVGRTFVRVLEGYLVLWVERERGQREDIERESYFVIVKL